MAVVVVLAVVVAVVAVVVVMAVALAVVDNSKVVVGGCPGTRYHRHHSVRSAVGGIEM